MNQEEEKETSCFENVGRRRREASNDVNQSSIHNLGSLPEFSKPPEKAHKQSKSTPKKSKYNGTGKKSSKGIKRSSKFSGGNISFTSSSDEGSKLLAKKIKASDHTRIPDT